jgi:hypothetical protein
MALESEINLTALLVIGSILWLNPGDCKIPVCEVLRLIRLLDSSRCLNGRQTRDMYLNAQQWTNVPCRINGH